MTTFPYCQIDAKQCAEGRAPTPMVEYACTLRPLPPRIIFRTMMNARCRLSVERARKLAALAQASGPEGDGARRRLEAMATRDPSLEWLLTEGALKIHEIELTVPSWIHAELLLIVAERLGCEVAEGTLYCNRPIYHRVSGPQGRLRQVIEHYERFVDPISAVMDVAGRAAMKACSLPEQVSGEPGEELDFADLDAESLAALLPKLNQLLAQRKRIDAALARVPVQALQTASKRLAALVTPAVTTPRVLLPCASKAWNCPSLTYAEFLTLHKSFFPASELYEFELEYKYRDGLRLYPPTRRYRTCSELAVDCDDG